VTALRRGIDETHRRFEDLFNRGDAASAARSSTRGNARILPPGAETVRGRDRSPVLGPAAAAPQTACGVELSPRSICSRWRRGLRDRAPR